MVPVSHKLSTKGQFLYEFKRPYIPYNKFKGIGETINFGYKLIENMLALKAKGQVLY